MPAEELNWRGLVLVSATACTLTAVTIFLFLSVSNSPHFSSSSALHRRRRKNQKEDQEEEPSAMTNVVYLNNPDACYDYVVGKEGSDEFEDCKTVVKAICPAWKDALDEDIAVKIIVGGITNRLYRLMWKDESALVRIYGDNTEEFIDRTIENKLFALLSERGFAPLYYGQFKNGRIEGWLDARALEPEQMSQTSPINYLSLIAEELGTMHVMDIPGSRNPVLWEKVDRFEALAIEAKMDDPVKAVAYKNLNMPALHEKLQWLKSVLPSSLNNDGKDLLSTASGLDEITKQALAFASDVVFCHNDLLSGNVLYSDMWDRVQIIDYEYCGFNFRAFDFANHFCENCGFELDLEQYPGPEKQFLFFKAYMSKAAPELLATLEANRESKAFFHALYDVSNRYALASHLFWGFWAIVQAAHSKIDFDFIEYAKKRFDAFDQQRSYFFG